MPGKHWLPSYGSAFASSTCVSRADERVHAISSNGTGGIRSLLAAAAALGSPCRIVMCGDSVIHDLWAAAVSGVARLGHKLVECEFNAGHSGWLEGERQFCNSNKSKSERMRLPKQDLLTSFAVFAISNHSKDQARRRSGRPPTDDARCSKITLQYYDSFLLRSFQAKYMRDVAPPSADELISSSSVVIVGGGSQANTVPELVGLANKYLKPWLLRSSPRSDAVGLASFDSSSNGDGGGGLTSISSTEHLNSTSKLDGAARIMWLEIAPQHFPHPDGTGSYSWTGLATNRRCVPIRNVTGANWRNDALERWAEQIMRRARDDVGEKILTPRTWHRLAWFDILQNRHDMHGLSFHPTMGPDCTVGACTP